MNRVTRLLAILALASAFTLSGCAALQEDFSSSPTSEDRAVLEQAQTLQQKLQQLQEQLAMIQAQEALAKGRKEETPPAWAPLTEMESAQPGFGRYTYVLFRDQQRYAALFQSLDALPARTDIPAAEANRFLLPLRNGQNGGRPDWDDYHAELAATCLETLGGLTTDIKGPLLVSVARPLGQSPAGDAAALVVDLAGSTDSFVAETLAAYQGRVVAASTGAPTQAPLFWSLLERTAAAKTTVTKTGSTILLSWRP